MDALCQLIEAFTCKTPNPFTDSLCLEGLQMAARSLRKAFHDGSDLAARGDMLLAAHFSGIALANAKLGAAHGFAAPLGGMYDAPHGALCAALLPAVLAVNQKALGRAGSSALQRYGVIAALLTGNPSAKPRELVEYCDVLRGELGIPRLADLGVEKKDFGALCEKAAKSSSMKGNPADLSGAELMEILDMAY
jgi:alcohol dehydrogenase class IV